MELERIAIRIASKRYAYDYEKSLDNFMERLVETDKLLEDIREKTSSPEGKVIITGLHQDMFQLISDFRKWIRRLKFISRSKQEPIS